ncbi:MAG: C_GCAxxG_C_C family protein [Desulfobacteraceae bacterium]|nr:C_GCAxxG_C_C family protein [Desulfobacteraceae bacterium]
MIREEAEKKVFDYFQSGFNCAEAVSKAITEMFGHEQAPKVATAFGRGIGSKEETCGALTGGIIALGYLFGRADPGESPNEAHELAAEFRKRFIEKVGASVCKDILKELGEQKNFIKCKKMTSEAAGILADLLAEKNEV